MQRDPNALMQTAHPPTFYASSSTSIERTSVGGCKMQPLDAIHSRSSILAVRGVRGGSAENCEALYEASIPVSVRCGGVGDGDFVGGDRQGWRQGAAGYPDRAFRDAAAA